MKKEKILISIIFLITIISLNSLFAQPIFQTNINSKEGLQVFYPTFEAVKQNSEFNLNIHVANISNGVTLPNTNVDCRVHIYDITGNHTFESGIINKNPNGYDHDIFISSGNFSKIGQHAFYVWCNSTDNLGGEVRETFQVTRTGKILEVSESLTYFVLSFGVLLLFLLSFYFMLSTPYENKVNEKGAVIKITKLKYVKLGLILSTWVLFTWFLNILIGLSENFVNLTIYSGFFGFIFQVMNNLALPLGIIILVISFFEIIRDANIQKAIKKFGSSYR